MTELAPPLPSWSRRHRSLIMWVYAPLGVGLLGVLGLLALIMCSGDLRPVLLRAKAAGVATTWTEGDWEEKPGHAAEVRAIEALAARLPWFGSDHDQYSQIKNESGATVYLTIPGTPRPAAFISVFTKADPSIVMEIDRLIADVGSPLRPSSTPKYKEFVGIIAWRTVSRWQLQRLLALEQVTTADVERLLGWLAIAPDDGLAAWNARNMLRNGIVRCLGARLPIQHQDRGAIGALLRIVDADRERDFRRCAGGQFIRISEALAVDPWQYCRDGGIALSSAFELPGVMSSVARLGRVAVLQRQLQWLCDMRATSDLTTVDPRIKPYFPKHMTSGAIVEVMLYQGICCLPFFWASHSTTRDQTMCELFAAEYAGTAWPIDTNDPMKGPLRRHEIDGRLIGAYSVGKDGINQHGSGDDFRILLYAPRWDGTMEAAPSKPPGMPVKPER